MRFVWNESVVGWFERNWWAFIVRLFGKFKSCLFGFLLLTVIHGVCVDEHDDISIKCFIPGDEVMICNCDVAAARVVHVIPSIDSGRLCRPSERSEHFSL